MRPHAIRACPGADATHFVSFCFIFVRFCFIFIIFLICHFFPCFTLTCWPKEDQPPVCFGRCRRAGRMGERASRHLCPGVNVVLDVELLQSHRVAIVRTEALLESRGCISGWLPHRWQTASHPLARARRRARSLVRRVLLAAPHLPCVGHPVILEQSPVCVTGLVCICAPDGCSWMRIGAA